MTQTTQTDESEAAAVLPSGAQFEISGGGYRAVVTEAGAGLRELAAEGPHGPRPLLYGFPEHAAAHAGAGQLLAPWPNRVADARYRFDGEERQLDVSEPAKGNAIHGLVRWAPWQPVERAPDRVVLAHRLFPQPGYPHHLVLTAEYRVGDSGLEVTVSARNAGTRPAPYGFAAHPYLTPGEPGGTGRIDAWSLQVPAGRRVLVDDRLNPTGLADVAGSDYDFRTPRRLAGVSLDTAFGSVLRDPDGIARVRLTGADGGAVTLWMDRGLEWVQVFTADPLADDWHRAAVALEPMSCPPNAFNSGDDLVTLAPGRSVRHRWGISAR
ncbi:MAG TPA: aldose 1-epimerase family protein [Actinocrinis sp.]